MQALRCFMLLLLWMLPGWAIASLEVLEWRDVVNFQRPIKLYARLLVEPQEARSQLTANCLEASYVEWGELSSKSQPLKLDLKTDHQGQVWLRLLGANPIQTPTVELTLESRCPLVSSVRSYTLNATFHSAVESTEFARAERSAQSDAVETPSLHRFSPKSNGHSVLAESQKRPKPWITESAETPSNAGHLGDILASKRLSSEVAKLQVKPAASSLESPARDGKSPDSSAAVTPVAQMNIQSTPQTFKPTHSAQLEPQVENSSFLNFDEQNLSLFLFVLLMAVGGTLAARQFKRFGWRGTALNLRLGRFVWPINHGKTNLERGQGAQAAADFVGQAGRSGLTEGNNAEQMVATGALGHGALADESENALVFESLLGQPMPKSAFVRNLSESADEKRIQSALVHKVLHGDPGLLAWHLPSSYQTAIQQSGVRNGWKRQESVTKLNVLLSGIRMCAQASLNNSDIEAVEFNELIAVLHIATSSEKELSDESLQSLDLLKDYLYATSCEFNDQVKTQLFKSSLERWLSHPALLGWIANPEELLSACPQ